MSSDARESGDPRGVKRPRSPSAHSPAVATLESAPTHGEAEPDPASLSATGGGLQAAEPTPGTAAPATGCVSTGDGAAIVSSVPVSLPPSEWASGWTLHAAPEDGLGMPEAPAPVLASPAGEGSAAAVRDGVSAASPRPVSASSGCRAGSAAGADGVLAEVPTCVCAGEPLAMSQISRTAANPDRLFWTCRRPKNGRDGPQCAFFLWADGKDGLQKKLTRSDELVADGALLSSPSLAAVPDGGGASTPVFASPVGGGVVDGMGNAVAPTPVSASPVSGSVPAPGAGGSSSATPSCQCPGEPLAVSKTSHTAANPDREFWTCKRPRNGSAGKRCSFFEWADGKESNTKGEKEGKGRERQAKIQNVRPAGENTLRFFLRDPATLSANFLPGDVPEGFEAEVLDLEGVSVVESAAEVRRRVGQEGARELRVKMTARGAVESAAARFAISVDIAVPENVLQTLGKYALKESHRNSTDGEARQEPADILPAKMREKLMDFQWEGIRFALRRDGRALIGDDMGLGKTLQAIAVASVYRSDWPLLIICPSSLRFNWRDEFLLWLGEDIDEEEINVIMKGSEAKKPFKLVNIVSYDLAQKVPESELEKCNFIICDESHYLKNRDAKRTSFVIPFVRRCKRSLLLSGTPALSRPSELFSQVSALEPELFPSYGLFTKRYCNAHRGPWGWDVSGSSNLGELFKILNGSCLIRRKKEDVLTQLPDKQRGIVWVATNSKVMKDVLKATAEFEIASKAYDQAKSPEDAMACMGAQKRARSTLYQLSGQAKLDSVVAYVRDLLNSTDGKVLIFAHHKAVIEAIDTFVRTKLKLETIVIDGSTAQHLRQDLCKSFQNEPSVRVAVLSITAAGVGLTLTAASQVVFTELYWNPGSLLQAEDRAHRIGQKDCVMVTYLLAKGTHDQTVWDMVRDKLYVVGNVLTGASQKMTVDTSVEKALIDSPGNENDRVVGPKSTSAVTAEVKADAASLCASRANAGPSALPQ